MVPRRPPREVLYGRMVSTSEPTGDLETGRDTRVSGQGSNLVNDRHLPGLPGLGLLVPNPNLDLQTADVDSAWYWTHDRRQESDRRGGRKRIVPVNVRR